MEAEPLREMPPPLRDKTLFQHLRLTKADIAGLRRPAGAPPDWGLERDSAVQALMAELRAERTA